MKNNKFIKFVLKHAITISACVLVLAFGIGYWALSQVPTATSIGNDIIVAGKVGIGTTAPSQTLHVVATTGSPATSGTTQNGILRIGGSTGGNGLDIGVLANSPYSTWMQSGYLYDFGLAAYYPISLNPLGGNVGIGVMSPVARLDIDHGAGSGSVLKIAQAGISCRFEPWGATACPSGWVTVGIDPTNNYRLCMDCQ